jgi:hypothetical protein
MQVEGGHEFRDKPGYPGERQVGVGAHRLPMCPERQRRCHAPVIDG